MAAIDAKLRIITITSKEWRLTMFIQFALAWFSVMLGIGLTKVL